VQTYHLGEDRGRYYIAMEFIHGVNLEQFTQALASQKVILPPDLAVFIASRVARGLAYAHSKRDAQGRPLGIVHRDVSCKNIMIAFEGDVKLMDFGIAKARGFLTDEEGQVAAGKPEYMSPEQADFQVTDSRSDLFSAGVVLSELLLGRNLFREATAEATRASILKKPIPHFGEQDSRIGEALNAILQKALDRDLDRRYQTAGEFLHDLEYYIYHQGYGPTNETLGNFVRELCNAAVPAPVPVAKGDTALLERTARIH
jgi:serine/threonine-protein kinase